MRYLSVKHKLVARSLSRCLRALIFVAAAFALTNPVPADAQSTGAGWEEAAGSKMAFEVASVKQNESNGPSASNFSWSSANATPSTEGLFSGTNWPLYEYIVFAYKLLPPLDQGLSKQLPQWALNERFDIEARAAINNPTKDQFRLMVQALLSDRFKLSAHFEVRQGQIFAIVLDKPGKLGPQLRAHVEDPPCADPANPVQPNRLQTVAGGFPELCGAVIPMRSKTPGRIAAEGGRNVPLSEMADRLSVPGMTDIDRRLADKTGLTGTFDFFVEWTPQMQIGQNATPEMKEAPTLIEAFKDQLGLKLEPATGSIETFTIDRIEPPSSN